MMVHIDHPPPTLEDVLARLRPGDILTHCFRPFPNNPATADGGMRDAVIEARKRGILFDIGHGMGSFAFKTARTMAANGFAPDCISSDVHALCIDGPAFDLLTTMSKFLCLGMKLNEVVRAATAAPAKALRRSDLGSLRPGSVGEASILELRNGKFDYVDVTGERMTGDWRLEARGVVLNGQPWNGSNAQPTTRDFEDDPLMSNPTPEQKLAALGLTLPAVPNSGRELCSLSLGGQPSVSLGSGTEAARWNVRDRATWQGRHGRRRLPSSSTDLPAIVGGREVGDWRTHAHRGGRSNCSAWSTPSPTSAITPKSSTDAPTCLSKRLARRVATPARPSAWARSPTASMVEIEAILLIRLKASRWRRTPPSHFSVAFLLASGVLEFQDKAAGPRGTRLASGHRAASSRSRYRDR